MSKIIKLKGLYLKNFKDTKDLDIDFGKVTNIFGDNGTGKTTVNDAFTWLLFNKDSHDLNKFDVQPLDEQGNVIDNLETEVVGTLEIDGVETVLRKVFKQKWVRKRGAEKAENTGNTTDYYINEVPQKEKEYKQRVSGIIQEDIFKLLTNPMYFSSIMSWKDRRKIIFNISGDVNQEDVINYNNNLLELKELLNPNESMEDFQKRVKAQISKLKKDQQSIPARVDECHNSIKDLDFNELELRKENISREIESIENKMVGSSKVNDELLKKRDYLWSIKDKIREVEQEEKRKAQKPREELNRKLYEDAIKIRSYEDKLQFINNSNESLTKSIERKEQQRKSLKQKWYEEQGKELIFDENEFVCPTCHRAFESDDIDKKKDEMQSNFNENKAKTLKSITSQGQALNKEIDTLKAKIKANDNTAIKKDIEKFELESQDLKNQIAEFKPVMHLEDDSEYQELKDRAETLEKELQQNKNTGLSDLKTKKRELENKLENINTQLSYKNQNSELEKRIDELQEKQEETAQRIAELEKAQYLGNEFTRTKIELLESNINSKFKLVKIRLFKNLISGGLEEDCEVMVNGVPFSTNLNSGSKINAGLDVINALSDYYKVKAPIFVDNKESVTQLIDIDSQIINLIVSSKDKKLRIESEED